MSEETQKEAKPKRKVLAIVPVEPEVRLGSLAVQDPKDLVRRGTELATALADIIEQKQLFVVIQKRKYVKAEGWLTLGAMLGVVPIEEYCRRLPDSKGFEAKINLIRAKDGGLVGAASAECTYDEKNWVGRDSYSLRSMSLTRATGKAFRLSFGWIMKLANYEATPAEEMFEVEGSQKQAGEVAQRKIAEAQEGKTLPALFFVWYDASQTAEIKGDRKLMEQNADVLKPLKIDGKLVANLEQLESLKYTFETRGIPFHPLKSL